MTKSPTEFRQNMHERATEEFRSHETTPEPVERAATAETYSPEETNRLLHELRLHHVELEKENETLRRSQNELVASRARYIALYDLAPVSCLTLSSRGLIKEANRAAAAMLGVDHNDLIENEMSTFVFHEDRHVYYQHRKKVLEVNAMKVWEMRMLQADGSPFWARLQGALTHNGEYWIAMVDITERKQAEEKLRQWMWRIIPTFPEAKVKERTDELLLERDNLKGILDAMNNGVYIVNRQLKIEYANPALLREFGPVEGRKCHVYLHGRQDICPGCRNKEVFSGRTIHREWTSMKSGKTYSTFDSPYKNVQGEICKLAILHDVTAMKSAELTINNLNQELEQRVIDRTRSLEEANAALVAGNSELELRRQEAETTQKKLQQLSSAVENSPATIVITDYLGRIEYVNPKFTELTGYLPEEAIGQNPKILSAGGQPQELYRELWSTISAGREWRGGFCNRKKSGEIYWERASISPIRDKQGNITHFVAIKEDVTEQKRIADELLAAQYAADAANRSKSEFLANMSHEIRTPLNAIIGFSSLALKSSLSPRQQEYVRKIQTAGKLLLTTVGDILNFSKIEAGQLEMEQIPFRLDTVLATTLSMVQQKALEKGLKLSIETSQAVVSCLIGDPHRLGQVIINLLSNAVKFTEQGEVVLVTELLARNSDRVQLQFAVRDTGVGISSGQISKLFQPFTQADGSTTRRFGGTGLGLSISKQLVELMGGEIWCESNPVQGSCFCFTAWFGIDQASNMDQYSSAGSLDVGNEEAPFDFSDSRVLMVEDNETLQLLGFEILKETGAVVHLATNGMEAVTMITGGTPYDLVLMDIQMPVMDGYDAVGIIRSDSRFAALPIIAMTGHVMLEEQQKIMRVGMDAIITKPFGAQTMLRTMQRFLREQESDLDLGGLMEDTGGDGPALPDAAPQTGDGTLSGLVNVAAVTPVLNRLLGYINGRDGRAERYLDDYHNELAGLSDKDVGQIRIHLNNFNFTAAGDALLALTSRNGIMLSSGDTGDHHS